MDRQQNFVATEIVRPSGAQLNLFSSTGSGEVAQMAYTYQVILNEQIKAMCLPIEILWILFLEQVKSIDIDFVAIIIFDHFGYYLYLLNI